jgi:hypothetical protein
MFGKLRKVTSSREAHTARCYTAVFSQYFWNVNERGQNHSAGCRTKIIGLCILGISSMKPAQTTTIDLAHRPRMATDCRLDRRMAPGMEAEVRTRKDREHGPDAEAAEVRRVGADLIGRVGCRHCTNGHNTLDHLMTDLNLMIGQMCMSTISTMWRVLWWMCSVARTNKARAAVAVTLDCSINSVLVVHLGADRRCKC